jgi:hypothetical protein
MGGLGRKTMVNEFIYLTPSVPLSFKGEKGEGEGFLKRGANAPLKHPFRSYFPP